MFCILCKQEKHDSEMVKRLGKLTRYCIVCKRIKNAEYERNHKIKARERKIRYLLKTPWYVSMASARQRCNDKKSKDYKAYGGKGIKFLMTSNEVKILWFRDKAYEMKQPSLDRKNSKGNYEFSNCRFMELIDNIKRQFEVKNA
jgi:hypothetical protein